MAPNIQSLGIDQLAPDVRLQLIAEIWNSLNAEPMGEIPEDHRQELERRLAAREANPQATAPWSEVKARLRARK